MEIKTKVFGTININEEDVLTFEEGIIGFEDRQKYVLLGNPEENESLVWLQSLEEPNLAFIVIQPRFVRSNYSPEVHINDLADLELEEAEDALMYSIITVPDDIKKMTINLKAPLIINIKNNKGVQLVLNDDRYQIKEPLIVEN